MSVELGAGWSDHGGGEEKGVRLRSGAKVESDDERPFERDECRRSEGPVMNVSA